MSSEFEPLIAVHAEFMELLLAHQEALVRGDLEAARARIAKLRADLAAHMRHEEEKLLPVLERGGTVSRIGLPRYYREDHDKIRRHLDDAVAGTAALDPAARDVHRRIVQLLHGEHALRALLEHHDERERLALFPDLERLTFPEERLALIEPPE